MAVKGAVLYYFFERSSTLNSKGQKFQEKTLENIHEYIAS